MNDKSVDGVLETHTWGGKMVGADDSTELSHPHLSKNALYLSPVTYGEIPCKGNCAHRS